MTRSTKVADSNGLLDAVLPQRNGVAVMLRAYFDASEREKGVFAVAGFAYRKSQAKLCAKEWLELFGPYGGCHMTDLANRQGRFKGISKAEGARLICEAISIINRRALYGVAVSCLVQEMTSLLPRWIDGFQGAYPVCCHIAMMQLGKLIQATGPIERVGYVFESGDGLQSVARRFIGRASMVPELRESYLYFSDTYASKDDVVQLQTADILAWEWAKYFDETVIQKRRLMRKSLIAILTHGSQHPAEANKERVKYTHLTGAPLAKFARQIEELGLAQIKEEDEARAATN